MSAAIAESGASHRRSARGPPRASLNREARIFPSGSHRGDLRFALRGSRGGPRELQQAIAAFGLNRSRHRH